MQRGRGDPWHAKCIHYFLPASPLWLIREPSAAFIIQECFLWSLLKIRWDLKDRRRCGAVGRLLSFSCFFFFPPLSRFLYVFDTRRSSHLAAAAAADLHLCNRAFCVTDRRTKFHGSDDKNQTFQMTAFIGTDERHPLFVC